MLAPDAASILKLSGTWGGAILANIGANCIPQLGVIPTWAEDAGKWGALLAVFAGVFATVGIGVGQWLKNIRTVQEIKTQQRKDLAEIRRATEDAVCLRRRSVHECPLLSQCLIPEHTQPEIHDKSHNHDNDHD